MRAERTRFGRRGLAAFVAGALAGCGADRGAGDAPSAAAPSGTSCEGAACVDDLVLHVPSPNWEDQIIFFLMTDRFDDGDPSNNELGVGEYDPSREHFYSGGDIQGIIDRLDYIQGLGATTVWPTPLVLNQWRSQTTDFTGYGGYYAVDFNAIDPHNGTLADYQALSSELHRRGMYLIKDIVVNHTGFFFGYDGAYDPADTAENFRVLEDASSRQPAPATPPFDLIDRLNPDHAAADVYNWTPPIVDYQNLGEKQFTHQLGGLADINTRNPAVIDAFKTIYGDWIEKAGVDAFRIDTVRYVEPSFFRAFMAGEDGVRARAAATGREDFLVFGEVLDYSRPFDNAGERALAAYLRDDAGEILPSVISFPLKQDVKSIFGEGKPPAQLAYRLDQHMAMYDDPYVTPTLVDNHDVARFLATGSEAGFEQAFAFIFTIPGIPTIYQGSAQGFLETRQAMFAGGYLSDRDHFDTETDLYRFIASLAQLRTGNRALRRGGVQMLASNPYEAGLFAFRRADETQTLDVLFNTADREILVDDLQLPGAPGGALNVLYRHNFDGDLETRGDRLSVVLPARAIVVIEHPELSAELVTEGAGAGAEAPSLVAAGDPATAYSDDIALRGAGWRPDADILLVKNGSMDAATTVLTDAAGAWSYAYPVANLGSEAFYLVAFDPESAAVSGRVNLRTRVDTPSLLAEAADPAGDDVGPAGTYVDLRQPSAIGQKDILRVRATAGGDVLKIELGMRALTTDWLPPNGFDNVAFNIFFDAPETEGGRALPQLDAAMPADMDWDFGHVVFGWGNTMFSADGATADEAGARFASAPSVSADRETKTVTFTYDGSSFGRASWDGVRIYISTWDIAGEGAYVRLGPEPADWAFGGGSPDDPKILDDVTITLARAE